MYGLYGYNGWYHWRIGKRSFNTLWGAGKRASRISRRYHVVVITGLISEMETDARFRSAP